MDEWQAIRLAAVWPMVIGATAVLAAFLILSGFGRRALGRAEVGACAAVGGLAWLSTSIMATVWDGSRAYWLTFTVGLALVAGVLVATATLLLLEEWRR